MTSYTGNYSKFEEQRAAQLAGQQAAYVKQQREIKHIQFFVDRFRAKASKAKQAQSRLKALSRLEVINSAQIDSPFSFRFEEPKKMPTQLVTVSNADIGYGDDIVLKNISMSIVPGDRIGLLGANGAGKSTLIKALVGDLLPICGDVDRANDLKVSYFAQHQVEQLRSDETPLSFLKRVEPKASEGELRKHLGGFAFSGNAALAPIGPFSGGEKAGVGIAFVFSIFKINPAPFCLLDEVDAPLDEANNARFCSVVREMSKTVQFIFITHNKSTMELADILSGVTMREPGVSKLVSVNVGEAVNLTANKESLSRNINQPN